MAQIDLRKCLNAVSDVVINRPPPLRQFDQIYMKSADMLMHVDFVSKLFNDKSVVFVGDGDAIGLCLVHLKAQKAIECGPKRVHVLDFDERMVNSITEFAVKCGVQEMVTAELYNVCDPLPENVVAAFDGFHVNPPFGRFNGGASVAAFMQRGFEACRSDAVGCVVLADDAKHPWSQQVLRNVQHFAIRRGWVISQMVPEFHGYHLDDAPELKSGALILKRYNGPETDVEGFGTVARNNFYGDGKHMEVRYVRVGTGAPSAADGCRLELLVDLERKKTV